MSDIAPARTLAELKDECLARIGRNAYPLTGLAPEDVAEAFAAITSLDRDEWAAAWSAIAARYSAEAERLRASAPAQARELYLQAWKTYSFARWPVTNSDGKRAAYRKALAAFRDAARLRSYPLETIRIPFEGGEIVAYLQAPKAAGRAPFVIGISGLDSRKEDLAERLAPMLDAGIGSLVIDSPGTGEAPLAASDTAERMYRHAIDVLTQRSEVDPARLGVYGASFGGHWAVKLAIAERPRLRCVVAQSPPLHASFQPDHIRRAVANTEYLFDYMPAAMSTFDNVATLDQLIEARGSLSLVRQGILDAETAPMLIVGGARDTQVPIADLELLLKTGKSPKEAWINPTGGHMGRQAGMWSDEAIFRAVIIPWLTARLTD
jgi:dienelactone hydrolase